MHTTILSVRLAEAKDVTFKIIVQGTTVFKSEKIHQYNLANSTYFSLMRLKFRYLGKMHSFIFSSKAKTSFNQFFGHMESRLY